MMETYEVNDTLYVDAINDASDPRLRIRRADGMFVVVKLNETKHLITALTDASADMIAEQVSREKYLVPCPNCNGTGRIPFYDQEGEHICEVCQGEGVVWTTKN
jgi:phage/plasmid primase-like uncharacterized protein